VVGYNGTHSGLTNKTTIFVILFSLVVIAVPNIHEALASHNANLIVSAENEIYENYFGGPMVIEVIVNDPNIMDIDESNDEPVVTVNGKNLRMVQGQFGMWYGYFADQTHATRADKTQGADSGRGLDFGSGCTATSASDVAGIDFSDTNGVYFPNQLDITEVPGELSDCFDAVSNPSVRTNHVTRENPTPSNFPTSEGGQLGITAGTWPFIQLYDFFPSGNVQVDYHIAGGRQSVVLIFDNSEEFINFEIGRTEYDIGDEVTIHITDFQLNIDPTDEDSWSFGTKPTTPTVFYQLFDEDGRTDADGGHGDVNLVPVLEELMFEDNGIFLLDPTPGTQTEVIVTLDDNHEQQIVGNTLNLITTVGGSIPPGFQPMTFVETETNNGIFTNSDHIHDANLNISLTANAGNSATIDYNDTPITISIVTRIPDLHSTFTNSPPAISVDSAEKQPKPLATLEKVSG